MVFHPAAFFVLLDWLAGQMATLVTIKEYISQYSLRQGIDSYRRWLLFVIKTASSMLFFIPADMHRYA